jgi:hypothetical protein
MLIQLDRDVLARNAAMEFGRGVRSRMTDLRPVWPGVRGVLYRNEQEVFEKEGAVAGETKWELNSNNPIRFHKTRDGKTNLGYLTWKRVNYPQAKIMELTGKLRRMVTGVTQNAYVREFRHKMVFGTDYADFSLLPKRPRSKRDRLVGDMGGVLDSGRRGKPYDAKGLGGQYPMEPRTIFRVTQASADEMADLVVDYITGTTNRGRRGTPTPQRPGRAGGIVI